MKSVADELRQRDREAVRSLSVEQRLDLAFALGHSAYNEWAMAERPIDRYRFMLRQQLPELAEKYCVRSLEVFGSYVRNEQTAESDLDVLVTFDKAPDLFQFIELENSLSDALGVKVDLVMKSALKARIGPNILREAVPV
jgi:hypothetical protein